MINLLKRSAIAALLCLEFSAAGWGSSSDAALEVHDVSVAVQKNTSREFSLASLVYDKTGRRLVCTIDSLPRHGTLELNVVNVAVFSADHRQDVLGKPFQGFPTVVTYRPDKDYAGPDLFSFQVTNRESKPQRGVISIRVVERTDANDNTPPVAHDLHLATTVGRAVSVSLPSLVVDPDGDLISLSLPENKFITTKPSFDRPLEHGVFSIDGQNPSGEVVSYIPLEKGEEELPYRADDGHGHVTAGTIRISNEDAVPNPALFGVPLPKRGFKLFVLIACLGIGFVSFFQIPFIQALARTSRPASRLLHSAMALKNILVSVDFLLVLLFFNAAFFYYASFTALPAAYYDGFNYLDVYDYFKYGVMHVDHTTFSLRILTPYLASLVPTADPVTAFRVINLIFINLTVALLYVLWRELKVKRSLLYLALFWLCFHEYGIIRQYSLWVTSVDCALYFFYTLLVYLLYKRWYWALVFITPLGVLQKESFFIIVVALFIYAVVHNALFKERGRIPVAPLAATVFLGWAVKFVVQHRLISTTEGTRDIFKWAWNSFREKMLGSRFDFCIRWVIAQFYVFGGFLMLGLLHLRRYRASAFNNLVAVGCLMSVIGSFLFSGTLHRLTFYGYPFFMTLILLMINDLPLPLVLISFVITLPFCKLASVHPFAGWYALDAYDAGTMSLYGLYMILCWSILKYLSSLDWGRVNLDVLKPAASTRSKRR